MITVTPSTPDSLRATVDERRLGSILAAAAGDALGYVVEFSSLESIKHSFGPQGISLPVKRNGVFQVSDDTQMSMAVFRGLLSGGAACSAYGSLQAVADEFVRWSVSPENNRAPGNACMAGCRKIQAGVPLLDCGGPVENSGAGGCGSVMRAHPYGLVFRPAQAAFAAALHSRLTHGAPLAMAASAAQASAVATLLAFPNHTDRASLAMEAAVKSAEVYDTKTAQMIRQAITFAADDKVSSDSVFDKWRGWAGHEAIAAAVFAFMRVLRERETTGAENTAHVVNDVIILGANTPGDSDSIASIAGALAGAYEGTRGLLLPYLMDLEHVEELRDIATQVSELVLARQKYEQAIFDAE